MQNLAFGGCVCVQADAGSVLVALTKKLVFGKSRNSSNKWSGVMHSERAQEAGRKSKKKKKRNCVAEC